MNRKRQVTNWGRSRQGLTLVELLIAMVVLLVGIYTVARGFPLMLYQIRGEGERTSMARLAEQALARLTDSQYGLPDAITVGGSLHPNSYPEDLADPTRPRTALDSDKTEIRGETFIVPAPYGAPGAGTTASSSYYFLSQGPAGVANWSTGYPYVYLLVPLTEQQRDPRVEPSDERNWFYVEKDGDIVVPTTVWTTEGTEPKSWPVSNVVVDYAWAAPQAVEPGAAPTTHHVQGELPADVQTSSSGLQPVLICSVHPARRSGGVRLVPGQTRAWARVDFTREEAGDETPDDRGRYAIDNKFGIRLALHPGDAGLTLKVDYQLRTERSVDDTLDRRLLIMMEDQPIETAVTRRSSGANRGYGDIRLAVKGIDDTALFTKTLTGAGLAAPGVHLVAADLTTGTIYNDLDDPTMLILESGRTTAPITPTIQPELMDGYQNGIVAIPVETTGGARESYVGHVWRFYYRTLNRHTVQIQKPARSYVDRETAKTYLSDSTLTEVDYRSYELTHEASAYDSSRLFGIIEFGQVMPGNNVWALAEATAGFTVAVNYTYVPDGGTTRSTVYGELHAVPDTCRITLNNTTRSGYPIEVLAVNGVSARARGWWLNRQGHQQMVDVETVFLANALGLVPRAQ